LRTAYSGYITTPEEFVSQQYEGASTLFARLTFDAYKEAFTDLGVAMVTGKDVASGPKPDDLSGAQIAWASKVDHDEVPIGQSFGQILRQPATTVARGSEMNIVYRSGNPRNFVRRNDSYFRIERDLGGGNWGLAAWDGTPDTKLYWNRSAVAEPGIGPGCPDPILCYWSTTRIVWNVPSDATPGKYRIRFFDAWKNGTTGLITTYERTSNEFTVQ
jgi:neutral ceramidase